MSMEDIIRYLVGVKYEAEKRLKAKISFSYMEAEDTATFKVYFPELKKLCLVDINDIQLKMHRGEPTSNIGREVSTKAIDFVFSLVKNW